MKINEVDTRGVKERFLRYVQIDTQSDPTSHTFPSTDKQKDLSKLLVKELKEMGVKNAEMDKNGYVYATLASNTEKNLPKICFCSHVDTSPDASGSHVKPLVHKNYQGQELLLPDDPQVIIRMDDHPDLKDQIGHTLITASGKTLLGADDKAGVAEIMTAVDILQKHPEIKHGEIKILFTPDEEIGRGVDKVNLEKLNADFAYTMDGERAGTMEDETFSANAVKLTVHGVSVHPGFAKNKMQNAIKIAAEIIENLPKDAKSPESTEGKEGFIHPVSIEGNVEKMELEFIIRDHKTEYLVVYEDRLESIVKNVLKNYPNASYAFESIEQYRNMKEVLDHYPEVVQIGEEGIRRAGLTPHRRSIRGGTDGARLSFMGLPCPNVFTGGHAFHSKQEWVSVEDMQSAVRTILHIANVWEEYA